MNAILRRDFATAIGGITLAFTLAPRPAARFSLLHNRCSLLPAPD